MSVSGKRKSKSSSKSRIFDTSVCQARFRKPRVLVDRNRSFDHDRELSFDPYRMIDARLYGVKFRDDFAIGFRNIGVSNIEELSSKEDWPDVSPATYPLSLNKSRRKGYDRTWGREKSYGQKWGVRAVDPKPSYDTRHEVTDVPEKRRSSSPSKKKKTPSKKKKQKSGGRQNVRIETGTPIIVPPRREDAFSTSSASPKREISSKDRKRAFAFNEYALALMEAGEYKRALTYFQKALDLDSTQEAYHINMGRCRQWLDYSKKGGRR